MNTAKKLHLTCPAKPSYSVTVEPSKQQASVVRCVVVGPAGEQPYHCVIGADQLVDERLPQQVSAWLRLVRGEVEDAVDRVCRVIAKKLSK